MAVGEQVHATSPGSLIERQAHAALRANALRPLPHEGTGAESTVVTSDAVGRATGDDALVDRDEDRGDDDAHDQGDPVDP